MILNLYRENFMLIEVATKLRRLMGCNYGQTAHDWFDREH